MIEILALAIGQFWLCLATLAIGATHGAPGSTAQGDAFARSSTFLEPI
jgi:hypothetical protein